MCCHPLRRCIRPFLVGCSPCRHSTTEDRVHKGEAVDPIDGRPLRLYSPSLLRIVFVVLGCWCSHFELALVIGGCHGLLLLRRLAPGRREFSPQPVGSFI